MHKVKETVNKALSGVWKPVVVEGTPDTLKTRSEQLMQSSFSPSLTKSDYTSAMTHFHTQWHLNFLGISLSLPHCK